MKRKLYPIIIAALVSAAGCGDSFYAAYDELTGPVESVYLPETATVMQTESIRLEHEVFPSLTANKNVTWSSTAGVTVDQNGVVTGGTVGTATVTVTTEEGGLTATCTVTVIALTAPDAPGTPTVVEGEDPHQLTVSWSKAPRATSYEIWYLLKGGSLYVQADDPGTEDVTGLSFTITGLTPGVIYYVKIKAHNSVGTSGDSPAAEGVAAYALRDIGPGGGYVFYDAGSVQADTGYGNWRYIEAAPVSTEGIGIQWGLYGTQIGLTGSNPGTGSANTAYIISWLNVKSETNRAAQVAKAVTTGGYTWFLPSQEECNRMYVNLKNGTDENGVAYTAVGDFTNAFYWSSTENNTYTAYVRNFSTGGSATHAKDGSFSGLSNYRVRAVHRFLSATE